MDINETSEFVNNYRIWFLNEFFFYIRTMFNLKSLKSLADLDSLKKNQAYTFNFVVNIAVKILMWNLRVKKKTPKWNNWQIKINHLKIKEGLWPRKKLTKSTLIFNKRF